MYADNPIETGLRPTNVKLMLAQGITINRLFQMLLRSPDLFTNLSINQILNKLNNFFNH